MKKILSLFTLLFAFCGMAWAQETAKPFKVSDAPTESGWAANTTWYYIKPARVDSYHPEAWLSAADGYIHTDGALKLTNGAKPADDLGLWCVVGDDTDGYRFYNKGKGVSYILGMEGSENNAFAKMYETANAGSAVTAFFYGASTAMPGNACFKLDKEGNNWWNNRDTGHTGGAHLALWNNALSGPNDKGSAFKFMEVGSVYEAEADLQIAINKGKLYIGHIGDAVNQYRQTVGEQPLRTIIDEAELLMQQEEAGKGELLAAKDEINEVVNGLTINQPVSGRFYRLRCKGGMRYLTTENSSSNNNRLLTENNQEKAALLFYGYNKDLLCFQKGLYFGNSQSNYNFLPVGSMGQAAEFSASNSIPGAYFVRIDNRFIFGSETIDSGTHTDNREQYNWCLEEVEYLPVAVSAAGWATLYAPVALTIPEGLTGVYTAAVEGNTLKLTALTDEIPANTPVLIEAGAATYNFRINCNAAAQSAETAGKGLSGTLETVNTPSGSTIFTLQKPEGKNIGFYKFNGQTLQGFRAYGDNLLGSTSAAGLNFEKGDVTAIENVEINDGKQTVIYDLSGRRVEKMLKGIYIVNGKKVIK